MLGMCQMNPNDLFWFLILFEFGDPTIDGVGEGEFDPSSLSDLFCGVFL
jgi:hypothetical protein